MKNMSLNCAVLSLLVVFSGASCIADYTPIEREERISKYSHVGSACEYRNALGKIVWNSLAITISLGTGYELIARSQISNYMINNPPNWMCTCQIEHVCGRVTFELEDGKVWGGEIVGDVMRCMHSNPVNCEWPFIRCCSVITPEEDLESNVVYDDPEGTCQQ